MADDDLKCELLETKKQLKNLHAENNLLKVKLRKMESDNNKKNKQIESLFDPRKNANVRKIVTEKGACMILNLKQRNEELEHEILTKNLQLKRLQAEIQMAKVYTSRGKSGCSKTSSRKHFSYLDSPTHLESCKFRSEKCGSHYGTPSISPSPRNVGKEMGKSNIEQERLAQNIEKIKQASSLILDQGSSSDDGNAQTETIMSMIEKLRKNKANENYRSDSAQCNMNNIDNNDIKKLQNQISKLLSEMEAMKSNITQISAEQEQTIQLLEYKNSIIENLAQQIKDLQLKDLLKTLKKRKSKESIKRERSNSRNPSKPVTFKKKSSQPKLLPEKDYSSSTFEEDIIESTTYSNFPSVPTSPKNEPVKRGQSFNAKNNISNDATKQICTTSSLYTEDYSEDSLDDDDNDVQTGD